MPSDITVGEYLQRWLEVQESQLEPVTWINYGRRIARYFDPQLGGIPLQALRVQQINELYADLKARGAAHDQPLSVSTVRRLHAVLHKALNDAARQDLVAYNVASKATLPKRDVHLDSPTVRRFQAWNAQELRRFLTLIEGRDQYQQDEHYFVVQLPPLSVDDGGWTVIERRAITATRWWPRSDLRRTSETVLPEHLAELLDRCAPITHHVAEQAIPPLPNSARLRFDVPSPPDLESLRATGLGMPRPPDLAEAEQWLAAADVHHTRHGFGYWSLRLRDDGPCLGFAGIDDRGDGGMWLGYAIHPDFRHRGLATEAAVAVAQWSRRWLRRPLLASVRPPNPASEIVLQRSGLKLHLRMSDSHGPRLVYLDT